MIAGGGIIFRAKVRIARHTACLLYTSIAQQPELSDIAANRQTTLQIKIKGDDDSGEDGETTTTIKGGRNTSKNRSIKYVCPKCGAIIRATKLVNVVCGDCDVAFEIAK